MTAGTWPDPWIDAVAALGTDILLKATVLLMLAAISTWALGRRRAVARSAVWNICLAGLLLLPLSALLFPRLRIDCLPHGEVAAVRSTTGNPVSLASATAARDSQPSPSLLQRAATIYESAVTRPGRDPSPALPAPNPRAHAVPTGPETQTGTREWHRALPTWKALLLFGYAAGFLLLAARLLGSLLAVRRLRRSSIHLEAPRWTEALERWRRQLGVDRAVVLSFTSELSVPVALGWREPMILLPLSFRGSDSGKLSDSVLLHELAHVRRRDYLWQMILRLTQAVYWIHPLTWWMARAIQRAREEACDDLCVHVLGKPQRYRDSLVDVARMLGRRLAGAHRVAMVCSTNLVRRIERIDSGCKASRCVPTPRAQAVLVGLLILGVAIVGALELRRPAPDDRSDPPRSLSLRIVHAGSLAPLRDVTVSSWASGELGRTPCDSTDEAGRSVLGVPGGGLPQFKLFAHKEGFVPVSVTWCEGNGGAGVPEAFTLPMEPGGAIGGIVRDEEGGPIGGATVQLAALFGAEGGPAVRAELQDFPLQTDERGRWRSDVAPERLPRLWIAVVHPEHPPWYRRIGTDAVEDADDAMRRLRDGTFEAVLERGWVLEGKVLDDRGRPVRGATVTECLPSMRMLWGSALSEPARIRTGGDGSFRLAAGKPGKTRWLVQARGFAPAIRDVTTPADRAAAPAPVEIRLLPGNDRRGRVVDRRGGPVEGATLQALRWRGANALRWSATTDREGRFVWEDAPATAVSIRVAKRGHRGPVRHELLAIDEEQLIRLPEQPRVLGRVFDAATGRPLERFTVLRGHPSGGSISWQRDKAVPFRAGRFDIFVTGRRSENLVRIEADGYLPAVSPVFGLEKSRLELDFELVRDRDVAGRVLSAAGAPLTGVEVHLLELPNRVRIQNGRLDQPGELCTVTTDAEGRFSFKPRRGPYALLVMDSDDGYALASDSEFRGALSLEPWGAVEGRVLLDGRTRSGERVLLEYDAPIRGTETSLHSVYRAVTDEGGGFAIPRLLPGRGSVAREVPLTRRRNGGRAKPSHAVAVSIRRGETTRVDIGGAGRSIRGRVRAASGSTGSADLSGGHITLASKEPSRSGIDRRYAARLESDGSFVLTDVLPGAYALTASMREPSYAVLGHGRKTGHASMDLTITDAARSPSAGPVDLGVLEVKVHRPLAVGDPAPPFSIETLDGKPLKLEDYRGKVVLLYFWSTSCGPCVAHVPILRKVFECFGEEKRFAMIGLNLDSDVEAARRFVAREHLGWAQGYLGNWGESPVSAAYCVWVIPDTVLMDPEGKVKSLRLLGESIITEVAVALDEASAN